MKHLRLVQTCDYDMRSVDALDAGSLGTTEVSALGERAVDMLDEWIERWKRVHRKEGASDHDKGRGEVYIQTIAFMLDVPVSEVRTALIRGQL